MTIVGLCVASVASMLAVLYLASAIGFSDTTSPQELTGLTADYPAVAQYLREQKQSEAHFITLANLIKDDQQQLLGAAALLAAIPVLAASAALGYFLARYLLRPVAEAYASQERFLQDAAHELRNPLATMSAVIQQTRQSRDNTNPQPQLAILDRQTRHLVRINEDLLFLERNKKRDALAIDAYELLMDVVETLQPMASEKSISVDVSGESSMLTIHPDDFVCLVRNLLENAIKYSGHEDNVSARLRKSGRTVILTVQDSGIGIPPKDVTNLGKRFYRASNVGRRHGTGLGLAIVEKIARDYNAVLHIDSTLGKGTTVTVTFSS